MGLKSSSASLALVLSISLVALVQSLPRIAPSRGNRRSSLLSSVLTDYWSERGFHDALTDHFIASESQQPQDFMMMSGDEVVDFRGSPNIRIPRDRLVPPARVRTVTTRRRVPRKRVQLTPATRKQDMEVLESVTLVDGGVQLPDGSIHIKQSSIRPQRKYQDVYISEGQISPLSYQLPDDSLPTNNYKLSQPRPRQPSSVSSSYHTLPLTHQYSYNQYQSPQPKPKTSYNKAPKSLHELSLAQFQKQLFKEELSQPRRPLPSSYSAIPSTAAPPTQPAPAFPIFVIQPPTPSTAPKVHPRPQPQVIQQEQQPQAQPTRQNLQQQEQVAYNSQMFQQQFQHPFGPSSPEPGSFAKFTATLLSTASGAANAAAKALSSSSQSQLPTSPYQLQQQPLQLSSASAHLPAISASGSEALSYAGHVSTAAEVPHYMPSPSPSQSLPQVLLPTTTSEPLYPTTFRPGVIPDDEQAVQNQLIEPESLAKKLTSMYETGRKILYFPKGVIDTVDTFLKQMERNPMVAYWSDKFFAKVFGDTSGT